MDLLITYVDDYGRGSADSELLKGFAFPRRKRVTESDIEKALAELAGMGCINLYNVDGESYFYFPNWSNHQRIQTKKSKFPEPPEIIVGNNDLQNSTVSHGESPPESNPIQSEFESESKSETESNSKAQDCGIVFQTLESCGFQITPLFRGWMQEPLSGLQVQRPRSKGPVMVLTV